jgi:hypothetical protein
MESAKIVRETGFLDAQVHVAEDSSELTSLHFLRHHSRRQTWATLVATIVGILPRASCIASVVVKGSTELTSLLF